MSSTTSTHRSHHEGDTSTKQAQTTSTSASKTSSTSSTAAATAGETNAKGTPMKNASKPKTPTEKNWKRAPTTAAIAPKEYKVAPPPLPEPEEVIAPLEANPLRRAFESLKDQVLQGERACDKYIKFMKDKAGAEASFAKNIRTKLAPCDLQKDEIPEFRCALDQVCGDMQNKANQHQHLSQQILDDVVGPLEKWKQRNAGLYDTLNECKRLTKVVRSAGEKCEKVYYKYKQARDKALQAASSTSVKVPPPWYPPPHTARWEASKRIRPTEASKNDHFYGEKSRSPMRKAVDATMDLSAAREAARNKNISSLDNTSSRLVDGLKGFFTAPSSSNRSEQLRHNASRMVNNMNECQNECERAWREYDAAVEEFESTLSSVMSSMQRAETCRQEEIASASRKFVVYESSLLANLQYDVQCLAGTLEQMEESTKHSAERLNKLIANASSCQGGGGKHQNRSLQNVKPIEPKPVQPRARSSLPEPGPLEAMISAIFVDDENEIVSKVKAPKVAVETVIDQATKILSDGELLKRIRASLTNKDSSDNVLGGVKLLPALKKSESKRFLGELVYSGEKDGEHVESNLLRIAREIVRNSTDGVERLVMALDSRRGTGRLVVDHGSFDVIVSLIMLALDKAEGARDYNSIRSFMIICQTFYTIRNNSNWVAVLNRNNTEPPESDVKDRIYLKDKVSKHKIWHDLNFWEGALFESLGHEMTKVEKYDQGSSDSSAVGVRGTSQSEKGSIGTPEGNMAVDVSAGQLSFFAYNMVIFGVPPASVRTLLDKYCMFVKLTPEKVSALHDTVNRLIREYQHDSKAEQSRDSTTSGAPEGHQTTESENVKTSSSAAVGNSKPATDKVETTSEHADAFSPSKPPEDHRNTKCENVNSSSSPMEDDAELENDQGFALQDASDHIDDSLPSGPQEEQRASTKTGSTYHGSDDDLADGEWDSKDESLQQEKSEQEPEDEPQGDTETNTKGTGS